MGIGERSRSVRLLRGGGSDASGFTLVELLVVILVIGILSAIAIPSLLNAQRRAQTTRAVAEIRSLEKEIAKYELDHNELPADLDAIGWSHVDPWDSPYEYVNLEALARGSGGGGIAGKARKDRFLVPINSDFDLYSKGPDGASQLPLTAKHSRDDIIRGGNGSFVGIAEEF